MFGELIIEYRHTGERLALRRVKRGDEVWLELKGSLPHRHGPPLHIHVAEDEEGFSQIRHAHRLCSMVADSPQARESGCRSLADSTHRWWNDGNEPLVFEGYARPVVDLDRFIQALFEVINAAIRRAASASIWPMPSYGIVIRRHIIMPWPFRRLAVPVIVTPAPCWALSRDGRPVSISSVGAPLAAEEVTRRGVPKCC